jgi:hypothetical protein
MSVLCVLVTSSPNHPRLGDGVLRGLESAWYSSIPDSWTAETRHIYACRKGSACLGALLAACGGVERKHASTWTMPIDGGTRCFCGHPVEVWVEM